MGLSECHFADSSTKLSVESLAKIIGFCKRLGNQSTRKMELKQDIFFIQSGNNKYIVYSPLRRCIFSANKKAVDIIKKYIADDIISDFEKKTKVWEYIKRIEKKEAKISLTSSINLLFYRKYVTSAVIIVTRKNRAQKKLWRKKN